VVLLGGASLASSRRQGTSYTGVIVLARRLWNRCKAYSACSSNKTNKIPPRKSKELLLTSVEL
jgi:hypothetical protein